jgi:hypothetical protein
MSATTQLVSGLAGAIGSDFRSSLNQLLFVEFGGKLSRVNLTRTASVVTSGTVVLKDSYGFNLDTGTEDATGAPLTGDIWWSPPNGMVRLGGAQLLNLGSAAYGSITPDTLQSLPYSPTTIPSATLVTGDVFAVHTNGGNFGKVLVVSSGLNLTIEWVTYKLDSPYAVLGTGYQEPEDVRASGDGAHVYVTERIGNLLKVPLASPNRTPAMLLTSGMTAPQQMFLDENHNAAYVVEYAPSGTLWRIDLNTGSKTAALTGLQNAVGVVLSADLQTAYISEQTTGPEKGRVSSFQLSNGARQTIVSGLTAPFFLTWGDAAQDTLLVPERDPANRITSINVTAKASQVVASGVPFRPSSVTLPAPAQMLICSDSIIEETDFLPFQPTGPLLMGIGHIPFDKVVTISGPTYGLADTTVDPTYFYQVKDTPFGGALPITLNYMRAVTDGAAYYRVFVNNVSLGWVVQDVTWTDEHWNGFQYVPLTTTPVTIAGQSGFFPTRAVSDLFLWMNPSLGGFIQSTKLPNGLNTIWIEFVKADGTFIEWSTALTILVDNNPCTATIATPTLHGNTADPTCGLLHYGAPDASPVSMPFTASHPNNYATFSFVVVKGVNVVTLPPLPISSAPVSAASGMSPVVEPVDQLLGQCVIAAFAEEVYVAATANNGWSRQSQYDAEQLIAFVLAP